MARIPLRRRVGAPERLVADCNGFLEQRLRFVGVPLATRQRARLRWRRTELIDRENPGEVIRQFLLA